MADGMRRTKEPKLAAQRLVAALPGCTLEGQAFIVDNGGKEPLDFQPDHWLRVLGYIIDLATQKYGFAMTDAEVWELCMFEPRAVSIKGLATLLVKDVGWPALAVCRMLRKGHPRLPEGGAVVA